MTNQRTDFYVVMGNPVAHSKSPLIHQQFARQTEQSVRYEVRQVPIDAFGSAVAQFRSEGGLGCNVTVPFKQDAWALADRRSDRAELAGAVNTLVVRSDGSLFGDNTDGVGLLRDLTQNLGLDLQATRVLILGAGGAVRGVIEPLLQALPVQLVIANRTLSRAQDLHELFADRGPVTVSSFENLSGSFDLIINGTAASLHGELPPLPDGLVGPQTLCYDMMYAAEPTPFQCWATDQGGRSADGLGMLVEQAAESFYLWRGVRPETASVIQALRDELSLTD